MTEVVRGFSLNIPANGSPTTIFFVDCELGDSNVNKILITFPPGCAGLVGVRLEHGGSQVYPLDPGSWFIFDNYTVEVDPTDQGTSGQWHLAGYNQDIYPHIVRVYFYFDRVDMSSGSTFSPPVSL